MAIAQYLQHYIGSFLTSTPKTKTSQKSFPFQFFYANFLYLGSIISYANDNESNTNCVYVFDYGVAGSINAFYHTIQGEEYDLIMDTFTVETFTKTLKERLFAAIYYNYTYGNVTQELARRLYKVFKDPYGTAILDTKLVTISYDKYDGTTYVETLTKTVPTPYNFPIAEEQLVNPPIYTFQALPLHNGTSFTFKNIRFKSSDGYDNLLPLNTIVGEEIIIPPGEKRSISIWYNIEVN